MSSYRRPRGLMVAVMLSLLAIAGCAGTPAGRSPGPSTLVTRGPGDQPLGSISPGAEDRVGPQLLSGSVGPPGVMVKSLASPYMDDLASSVCGNQQGAGVYLSEYGQRREWTGDRLWIQQFVSIFAAPDAAAAIAQVDHVLGCPSYRDRDGDHTAVHRVMLPALPHVDAQLMFCETIGTTDHQCIALLASRELLVRFQVRADGEAAALAAVRKLADVSAASLGKG